MCMCWTRKDNPIFSPAAGTIRGEGVGGRAIPPPPQINNAVIIYWSLIRNYLTCRIIEKLQIWDVKKQEYKKIEDERIIIESLWFIRKYLDGKDFENWEKHEIDDFYTNCSKYLNNYLCIPVLLHKFSIQHM